MNLSLGLDEFGKPLPSASVDKDTPSNTQSSDSNSHTPVTRIIPITLETSVPASASSSIDFSRENSMDELQNAIKLSMEPFLTGEAVARRAPFSSLLLQCL